MQKKLTEQGLRYIEAGQFDKAAQILALLIKAYPSNADAQHMLGIIELERNNYSAAYSLVKSALDLERANSLFYNTLGNIEMRRKRYDQAENAFLMAIKYDPEKIEYKYNLAHFYLGQNQYQKAIDFYYYILRTNPTHYLSIRGITVCYLFSNEPAIALEHAGEWVEEFAIYDEPYYYLGLCHYALNNIPAALEAYDRGISLNPNNYDILTAIGACYRALGNFSIAETYLLKSLSLESNNPTAMYNLGCIHLDQGNLDSARKYFLNSIGLDHDYAEPICGLGYLELIDNNEEKALEYFARAQRAEPLNIKPQLLTATTLLRTKQFQKGWQAYHATLSIPKLLQDIASWHGEKLTAAQTLLVWAPKENYNLTQQLLFASLIPELKNFATNVLLLCDANLVSLFQNAFPEFEVVNELNVYNMQDRFVSITHHIPFNCLGEHLRTSEVDFKQQPCGYLKNDSVASNRLRQKYQAMFPGKKLVGIAWRAFTDTQAVDHIKSNNLSDWDPILKRNNCQFINLQPQLPTNTAANIYTDQEISNDELPEQIASLDLIISVDNHIASLAGGLNIPTYTMIPANSEWYWFNGDSQSIWFPSMHIFKQQHANVWIHPVKEIAKLL